VKPLKERNPAYVALAGLAVLAVLVLAVFYSDDLPFIGAGTGYTAYFSEAAGLAPGNEVRIAGVRVGKVTGVALAGDKVAVTFRVKDAWVGNRTTAAIEIKTLLGDKYLALDPRGNAALNPSVPIPLSRTTSPYDVTQAFSAVGGQISQINTRELTQSLETLSAAFATTPPYVRKALSGLAALSASVAGKDQEVTALLANARRVTRVLADEDGRFDALINDGKTAQAGLEQPVYYWTPSIAPSGMAFYTGKAFPAWKGDVFVGAMSGQQLVRLELKGGHVVGEEKLLMDRCKRTKDVREGPDGMVYVITDEPVSEILRLVPAK